MNPKYLAKWKIFMAGLSPERVAQCKKHREIQVLGERFMQAQERVLKALWSGGPWQDEQRAADAAFIQLSIRRGHLT